MLHLVLGYKNIKYKCAIILPFIFYLNDPEIFHLVLGVSEQFTLRFAFSILLCIGPPYGIFILFCISKN